MSELFGAAEGGRLFDGGGGSLSLTGTDELPEVEPATMWEVMEYRLVNNPVTLLDRLGKLPNVDKKYYAREDGDGFKHDTYEIDVDFPVPILAGILWPAKGKVGFVREENRADLPLIVVPKKFDMEWISKKDFRICKIHMKFGIYFPSDPGYVSPSYDFYKVYQKTAGDVWEEFREPHYTITKLPLNTEAVYPQMGLYNLYLFRKDMKSQREDFHEWTEIIRSLYKSYKQTGYVQHHEKLMELVTQGKGKLFDIDAKERLRASILQDEQEVKQRMLNLQD